MSNNLFFVCVCLIVIVITHVKVIRNHEESQVHDYRGE